MLPSCKDCPYRDTGVLKNQSGACATDFPAALARYWIRGANKTILHEGEIPTGIYFLCEGAVKLSRMTEEGDEVVLDWLTPCSIVTGSVLGQPAGPETGNEAVCTATTIGEATAVAFLKIEDCVALLRAHPELGFGFAQHLSARLRNAYEWTSELKLPVEKRVISCLRRIAKTQSRASGAAFIKIPLSHQELAQFAPTTPETLSRTFRRLKEKGVVRLEKNLVYLNAELLEKVPAASA